jgi:UDP-N-acetylmuramate dehydrogenase
LRAWQEKRAATQPLEWPSCGSVFRNPAGDHAARLIEAAGLKGKARGQAEVSSQHANFIINRGDAQAADIEALVEDVQTQVQQQFGIRLQAEMRILGEAKHG